MNIDQAHRRTLQGAGREASPARARRARRLIALVALSLLASCGGQYVTASSGVEIKRSGALGHASDRSIYWIDNERVLFIGGKPGVFETLPDGRRPGKRFLMEWNIVRGDVRTRAEIPGEYQGLCYARGYVRYHGTYGDKFVVRAGPLGKEVDISVAAVANMRNGIRVNPHSCREYDERVVRSRYGPGFIPLRKEHGYIGGREDARKRNMAVYITIVDGKPKELLVPVLGAGPRWSEYAGGYIFRRSEGIFSATKTTGKMWLLKPDGETKAFDIPAGPWFRGSTGYGLTKKGVFLWSAAVGNYDMGDAGGYLMQPGGKPERFIEGYIYSFDVSPDGCKIAMSIALEDKPEYGPEMIMADVCGKGE